MGLFVSVCWCVLIVVESRTIAKIKNKKMTFADFNMCHRNASLRKMYFVTLTYFSKVKDSNRDLSTAANAHLNATSTSTAVLRVAS